MNSTTGFFPATRPVCSTHEPYAVLHEEGPARGAGVGVGTGAGDSRRRPARRRGLLTATALSVLCCVSLAGCDGSSSSSGGASSGGATAANNAAAGAGGASAPVAIVAAPASGGCAALGASATQPLQNTQLVCAP
ncbi:hypothetical protein LFL96_16290 [Paraburkholderia sp. D15]|uniref:hypothetical protein n=1 Tax=Paraburkholderia sp. D15 TaxID=2880218 RepID=UPI0024786432|nr:hypothetical protein [Paraburkholderia sp. D15]WGS49303.1 hypothetical protein LFL96_16290 [Paraburkholderia sp. D15]